MTNQEIKQLQNSYEQLLKEKLEGKTFTAKESFQVVTIIGSEFSNIAIGKFGLKTFNIQQNKEKYASTLIYKIICLEYPIVDIIISVTENEEETLTLGEIMCDFKINETVHKELLEKIKENIE